MNVSVVELTLYELPGSCTTPLIATITPADVELSLKVKATVLPSPVKLSAVMIVKSAPAISHSVPL